MLISVCALFDSSILAFSAASFRRCSATTSFEQVDAAVLLELGRDVVDHALVEVLAAEEGVAVGRQHFELLLAVDVGDLDDRDVEGRRPGRTRRSCGRLLSCLSRPKASAAAVGSLMMRLTSRPAMRPASLVAWRWASLK